MDRHCEAQIQLPKPQYLLVSAPTNCHRITVRPRRISRSRGFLGARQEGASQHFQEECLASHRVLELRQPHGASQSRTAGMLAASGTRAVNRKPYDAETCKDMLSFQVQEFCCSNYARGCKDVAVRPEEQEERGIPSRPACMGC